MKTTGMKHQLEALRLMNGKEYFGLFMEQGTGKTWTFLADAERAYAAGLIDALLIIAPKGVHTNWIRREIPIHLEVPYIAKAWRSGAGKREMKAMEDLLKPREEGEVAPLRILSVNIDALSTKAGHAFVERFLLATKALGIIDESSRIKTPSSKRTEIVLGLKRQMVMRRIGTGTPVTKAPGDVFSQFEFMKSGLLGTSSYRAFVAEYADLLPMAETAEILRKFERGGTVTAAELQIVNSIDWGTKRRMKETPRMAHAQIVRRDADGNQIWRNLDRLKALIQPHTFRVLKKDCLDLPAKIFKNFYFDLEPAQQAAYDMMYEQHRFILEDGDEESVAALSARMKLQQITSGFIMKPDRSGCLYVGEHTPSTNPRLAALMGIVEDLEGKVIVWARFKEELRAVAVALRASGRVVVEYHGEVNDADREFAVDNFQNGAATVFVGQAQSGGIGLTLTAAETVIYYSNDDNLETRLQSEDRAHRIGTKKNVVYFDLVATGTVDEIISAGLRRKAKLAAEILGDAR